VLARLEELTAEDWIYDVMSDGFVRCSAIGMITRIAHRRSRYLRLRDPLGRLPAVLRALLCAQRRALLDLSNEGRTNYVSNETST
jgi:hypothetical protein